MLFNKLTCAFLALTAITCTIPDKNFQVADDGRTPDAPVKHTLTVSRSGSGTGTITSAPAAIDCGSTCSAEFNDGTSITLTATPAADSKLVGWTGDSCSGTDPCTFTLSADASVGAEFALRDSATIVNVSSTTANGPYNAGKVISIDVTFDKAVTLTGTAATLALNSTGSATYTTGSGTTTLSFTYTVGAGQNSADLDYANSTALSLGGGTLQDSFGIAASLVLPAPGGTGSLAANKAIVIDTAGATVSSVDSTTAAGAYTVGGVISIQVHLDEAVSVTGIPTLGLSSGGSASYASGSGTQVLTFTHTVAAGQNSSDLDYASTSALALPGGATIRDSAGNNATLTLPALGGTGSLAANEALVIDTAGPAITNVTSTTANGTYTTNDTVSIQIVFNEAATVTGTPTLALNSSASASYASGSGTTTLTFTYTVAAGQNSADLDYVATTSLAGTIKDALGNTSARTLPAPGAVGSLGANKDIVINTCHGSATYTFTGTIQTFTTPSCASNITIEVFGAGGGRGGCTNSCGATSPAPTFGGKGARMKGDFTVTPSSQLSVLVGEQGQDRNPYYAGGGGGGSFVWLSANQTLLIAAGGGGGAGGQNTTLNAVNNGADGVTTINGTNGQGLTEGAGTNGSGGTIMTYGGYSAGGAGWASNGAPGKTSPVGTCPPLSGGGTRPLEGGAGGSAGGNSSTVGRGGFGGGGGGQGFCDAGPGGGGGGYSGGGGGAGPNMSGGYKGGGGGGSYNNGANQSNSAGVQTGNGQVIFTW